MLTRDTKEETAITRQESLAETLRVGTFPQNPWAWEHFHRVPGCGNFFIEPLRRWGKQLTSA